MKLHEYQSKAILKKHGLPVPLGIQVDSSDKVAQALQQTGIIKGVCKAQAYTGGRGKAGGVKLFTNVAEATELAKKMIGMTLVTHQTGPSGVQVDSVYLEQAGEIKKEFYLTIILDRAEVAPMLMVSPDGGMDIEEVAANTPERILRKYLPYKATLEDSIIEEVGDFLQVNSNQKQQLKTVIQGLYNVFCDYDAMLLEINPLIIDGNDNLAILDCKFDIDDNAVYRQLESGGDVNAEKTEAEIEAKEWGMSYISLDGKIGCMVNGAGLAMATMDSIKHYGSEPANFLDVGGSATEEAVAKAFEIISSDSKVECILINIFGGIMKCDTIANGIVAAVTKVGLKVPLVVRLEGTNVDLGKQIINNSGLNIISANDLADGAKKAVSLIQN